MIRGDRYFISMILRNKESKLRSLLNLTNTRSSTNSIFYPACWESTLKKLRDFIIFINYFWDEIPYYLIAFKQSCICSRIMKRPTRNEFKRKELKNLSVWELSAKTVHWQVVKWESCPKAPSIRHATSSNFPAIVITQTKTSTILIFIYKSLKLYIWYTSVSVWKLFDFLSLKIRLINNTYIFKSFLFYCLIVYF